MLLCVVCHKNYTKEDVKEGRYFPSTGVCLVCYQTMAKKHTTCLGNKELYDPRALGCKECPDRRICSIFVQHPNDSMKER